jgi:chromate transport protein ChrA
MTDIAPAAPRKISSTSDLTPAGILGYAKGLVVALALVLETASGLLPEQWQTYARAVIAVLGLIAVVLTPNAVQEVHVVAPPVPPAVP